MHAKRLNNLTTSSYDALQPSSCDLSDISLLAVRFLKSLRKRSMMVLDLLDATVSATSSVHSPAHPKETALGCDEPHALVVALALALARMAAREDDEVERRDADNVLAYDVP
jgi:hypothetical protein